jgi:O-antigen/teichoic acid export membrane protein
MNSTTLNLTRGNLVKNVVTLFSNTAISQGFTALTYLLTARQLGSTLFGQLSACLALASVTSVFFNLGLDVRLMREGARTQIPLSELVGTNLVVKVIAGIIWVLALSIFAILVNKETFPPALMAITALAVWMDDLLRTALSAYKASLRNLNTLLIESTSDVIWFAGTIALIVLGIKSPETFMAYRFLILFTTVIVAYLLIYRWIGVRYRVQTVKASLRAAPPYALSEFLAQASMRLDVVIIAFMLGSVYVGLYSPAVSIISALYFIPMSIYSVMIPALSSHFETNSAQAWRSARKFTGLLLVTGACLSIILFFGANWLVSILGESYANSVQILKILSVILFLKSFSSAMVGILIAGGQQSKRAIIQAVVVGLGALLNLIVISSYGITGVAFVFVLSELFMLLGYAYLVQRFRVETQSLQTV